MTTMLKVQNNEQKKKEKKKKKKKEKKIPKIQNLKFHNSLYNFPRDPSWEYAGIFGSKSVVNSQTRCRFFSHMVHS